MKTITVNELKTLLDQPDADPVHMIDVRTPAEFEAYHVPGAQLRPLDELDCVAVLRNRGDGSEPLYILCQSGNRARKAAERFEAHGFQDSVVVEGGSKAWVDAGLPAIRGRQTISLERQVRIGAGALVLTGVALGFTVHPAFFGLSAFVGCGLIVAGVTDWCGMGMLLAKMPWNNRAPGSNVPVQAQA